MREPTALTAAKLATFILRHRAGISVVAAVLALDQLSKLMVVRVLAPWESWPTGGPFHLTHAANSGATLDLFSGHTTALVLASMAAVGVLIVLYLPRPKTGVRPQVAFGLMLAGATGNLVDRVVLGHVVDFIDVAPWFIFNVADVAILAGTDRLRLGRAGRDGPDPAEVLSARRVLILRLSAEARRHCVDELHRAESGC